MPLNQPRKIKASFLEEEAPKLMTEGEKELAGLKKGDGGGIGHEPQRLLVFSGGVGSWLCALPFLSLSAETHDLGREEAYFHLSLCKARSCTGLEL